MVEVGRRIAASKSADNVQWHVQRAEDLEAPPEHFELVTIGSAFHRLHRRLVAGKALDWLKPSCCLAVMGSSSLWTGKEEWQDLVSNIVRTWTARPPVADQKTSDQPRETFQEALRHAGFTEVDERLFHLPHMWSLDTLVGYLYSLSGASKRVLGDKAEAFEADLRETLLAYDSSGLYSETIEFHLMLARGPAGRPKTAP